MFSDNPPDTRLDQLNQIFLVLNGVYQNYLITQAKELLKIQNQQEGENKPIPKDKKTP